MTKSNEARIADFRSHVKGIPSGAPRFYIVGKEPIAPSDIAAWVDASTLEKCALIIMCDMEDSPTYSAMMMMAKLSEIGASARLMLIPQFMPIIFINSNEEIEHLVLAYLWNDSAYAVSSVGPHLEKMEQATA